MLRVFVSSPGDVGRERELAAQVLNRLQGEGHSPGEARLPLEYEPMRATTDYQGNIPKPSDFDIVICILWSRLGSRLNEKYRHADGSRYASGTEYELEEAADSFAKSGTPAIYVYRNQQQPMIPIEPEDVREEKVQQYKALQDFVKRWFLNPDGTFKIASNTYNGLADFQDKLESDLHKIIEEKAPPLPESPDAKVRFGTYTKGRPSAGCARLNSRMPRSSSDGQRPSMTCSTRCRHRLLRTARSRSSLEAAVPVNPHWRALASCRCSCSRVLSRELAIGVGQRYDQVKAQPTSSPVWLAALMSKTALPEMAANGTTAEDLTRSFAEAPKRRAVANQNHPRSNRARCSDKRATLRVTARSLLIAGGPARGAFYYG